MPDIDLDRVRALVGAANVLTDADAAPALVDWRTVYAGDALAVVRPGTTDEVAAVMSWCAEHGIVVVPQGGNTGLSGGATPRGTRPCIALSLQRMRAIESVDAAGWTMTVQAGVTIEAMQEAAAAADRLFAPDWGARGSATIGGAIATDAGGNNVVRYGNMRDQVLGLEVVLADGRVWDGLRSLRKDSTGYDLAHLFVGSEGTLGVVTRAVVKLHPAPQYQQSAMAALTDLDRLMDVFALARSTAPDALTAFELLPETGVAKVCDTFDLAHPFATRADFYVLVRFAGTRPVTDLLATFLDDASAAGLATDAAVAATAEQEQRLWFLRDELPPMGLYPHQAEGLKLDAAVPIERMVAFHDAVRAIADELAPDALAYGFGHVGDGNLHMTILPLTDDDVPGFRAAKPELTRRIDEIIVGLGGTMSAEHGVGQELRSRVAAQKPPVEWELMRTIKAALDPDDRLNPGVLLPE
ncbi:MAG: oxidoreductase [Acidimicrobiales bacterium]|nr:MAG: oxidoreductase [Acidimicrobiales bacterium]